MIDQALYDNERSYWEDRLGADVRPNSVGFHGLSDTYVSWLYRVRAHRFSRIVKPFLRPGMRVLDIGSGGGFYIDLWRRLGVHDISATDLTEASLRAIRRRFPAVETKQFDVGGAVVPFTEGSFDAISCMDVVHHLMDDGAYERAFEHCARLLKPGGVVIFTDTFLHGPAYRGPHHISRSLIHIERVLRTAGLKLAVRRPMFVLMNNPLDSRSRLFKFYWKVLSFISENRYIGMLTGILLYPFELLLTSLLREGPSSDIAIAVRT